MNRIIYYSYIQLCDMCTDQFERKSNIRVPVLLPYLFFIPIYLHSHPKAALALPQWQNDHICLDAHLPLLLPNHLSVLHRGKQPKTAHLKGKPLLILPVPCERHLPPISRCLPWGCYSRAAFEHLIFLLPWLFGSLEHTRSKLDSFFFLGQSRDGKRLENLNILRDFGNIHVWKKKFNPTGLQPL